MQAQHLRIFEASHNLDKMDLNLDKYDTKEVVNAIDVATILKFANFCNSIFFSDKSRIAGR